MQSNPYFIAEIGLNHNGDLTIARQLIDMAKECGCHAVKFQKRDIPTVYSEEVLNTPRESPWGTTTREQKEGLEFGKIEYDAIDRYCRDVGIEWFASAWDIPSLGFLAQYDCPHNKIASAMLTHKGFVEAVAQEGKHTFVSTGMSTLDEIMDAIDLFKKYGTPYTLMHCVSLYPCDDEYCNVNMIFRYQEMFNCDVGYSGHEKGILPSVLAVSLGATAIERHITLDRSMYGSDQSASLERKGLEMLVRDCTDVSKMMGDGMKVILPDEVKVAHKLRYFHE